MTLPRKIGITGGIGSGKSLFCRFLSEAGAAVLYADDIAKDIYRSDEGVRKELIALFGPDAFTEAGLNNKYIAQKVFNNEKLLSQLNSIIHPAVIKKSAELMNAALAKSRVVFYEAALIYEANMEELFDAVLLITAPESLRVKRVVQRDGASEQDVSKRIASQIPEEDKMKRAAYIINNDGSEEKLKAEAHSILQKFNFF